MDKEEKQEAFLLDCSNVCFLVLQSLMLQIAANWIEQEAADIAAAKEAYMAENCAAPDLSGDQAALVVKTLKHSDRTSL